MMPTLPTLSTPRLTLRPLKLEDAPAIQALFPQWEIVRHLASRVPWPYPADGALLYLSDIALPAMQRGQEWHWTLRLQQHPRQLIGQISLYDSPNDNRGLWLAPEWQGQGLMQEALMVVMAYWFEVLDRPSLRATKACANQGSRRLSERCGMRLIATAESDYVAGRLASEVWEITREHWLQQRLTTDALP